MNKNVKIAKQLVKLAKSLVSDNKTATYGLMFQNPDAPKRTGDFPILKIKVNDNDIRKSQFYKDYYKDLQKVVKDWRETSYETYDYLENKIKQYKEQLQNSGSSVEQCMEDLKNITANATNWAIDSLDDFYQGQGFEGFIDSYVLNYIDNIIDSLKELAKKGITYMSGNFADWSEYYDRKPMENAQDVIEAAYESTGALGTFGRDYNFTNELDEEFDSTFSNELYEDEDEEFSSQISQEIIQKIMK